MMGIDVKAEEMLDKLRATFTAQIRDALHIVPAHQALQLADALCVCWLETFAGLRVTHRAQQKCDESAIAEDWARGLSWREISKKHGCSRGKAYKFHPAKQRRSAA